MLTAEEYIKYGMYFCEKNIDERKNDCKSDCPFFNKDFCVFPELGNINFNIKFALAVIENFKNECEIEISLKKLFLEKFPNAHIGNIMERECPLNIFGNIIKCDHRCEYKGTISCWEEKIKIEPKEVEKYSCNKKEI